MKWYSILVLGIALMGCASSGPKETAGGLSGAALTGYVANVASGGNPIWTVAGVTVGAIAGSLIGARLDYDDAELMQRATQQALETGTPGLATTWVNPQSGNHGSVTPSMTDWTFDPVLEGCRRYVSSIVIDGKWYLSEDVACKSDNEVWRDLVR
jgi:surface antigen